MSLPTIEEMNTLDNSDLVTYWCGSFAKMIKPGQTKGQWVCISSFDGHSKKKIVNYSIADGNIYSAPLTGDMKWDFDVPKARMYNFKNNIVQLTRLPHRQWKKGLCSDTFSAHENLYPYAAKFKVIPSSMYHHFVWGSECLDIMLEKMEPLSFEKSMESILKHQALARVFSERITLSQGVLSKNPTLWFDRYIIGEFSTKKDQIVLRGPELQSDVAVIFAKHGIEVTTKQ